MEVYETLSTALSDCDNKEDDELNIIKSQVYMEINQFNGLSDDELFGIIDRCIIQRSHRSVIPVCDRQKYRIEIFNSIRKLDIIQELLEDNSITEIMINGCNDVFIERDGKLCRSDKAFENKRKLEDIAQRIASLSNRLVNESVPIVDTRLDDGSRVNIVLPPIAIDGPVITIRKFYDTPLTMDKLIENNSITREAAQFLKKAVIAGYNIFISGGTGSGKTTFLNALSDYIPKDERIITIEDSAELNIEGVANLVRLEARNANIEGKNEVTIRDLIKSSLRMRPDRIIVGEVRGAETIDMLQAMNTGHDGSLSTGHGNSPEDMITRLETLVIMGMDMPLDAIRRQIASALDIIVHLGRLRDRSRKVIKIAEVDGIEQERVRLNTLYEFQEDERNDEWSDERVNGHLIRTEKGLIHTAKMESSGIQDY